FSVFGPGAMRRDVARAQALLSDLTGQAPRFFRPTSGLRNALLDPALHGLGLQLACWTRRGFDTRMGDAATVQARLLRGLAAGDILLLHDGHAARTPDGQPVLLPVLSAVVAEARRLGLQDMTLPQALS